MTTIFKQIPLYRFLSYCNELPLEKNILDCGAGGDMPPLSLFYENGYHTQGIEQSEAQRLRADAFARKQGQVLNIAAGDMRQLPFADASFSFVYSYNSVFHMKKAETRQAIHEMKRVLRPGGLFFVNFLTVNDHRCGAGVCVGENEYEQEDDGLPVIHSYFQAEEPDAFFPEMELLYKEDRTLERIFEGRRIRQGFVDYILKK